MRAVSGMRGEKGVKISASHGSGGRDTAQLIQEIFEKRYGNDILSKMEDAAVLPATGEIAFTTDSFVVDPLFFPNGDIGRLAVCGTVNDLLTTGAVPKYLSAGFILEEGLEIETLKKVAASMAEAAQEAGVKIVTGDTKVIDGKGGLYINTAGIGLIKSKPLSPAKIRPNDAILITGTLGDHHACILSQRMGIENSIKSDVAPLCEIVKVLRDSDIEVHCIRDITRGGVATVLNELSSASGLRGEIWEESLPVSKEVAGFCGVLGLDPLYMGNEGKMLIILPWEQHEKALQLIKGARYGENAAAAGKFTDGKGVVLKTKIGGLRTVSVLAGEGLPRIC